MYDHCFTAEPYKCARKYTDSTSSGQILSSCSFQQLVKGRCVAGKLPCLEGSSCASTGDGDRAKPSEIRVRDRGL